ASGVPPRAVPGTATTTSGPNASRSCSTGSPTGSDPRMTGTAPTLPQTGSGLIGKRLPRLEDFPLLRGEAVFCGDVELPGLLDVAFVRSFLAHALVTGVDITCARAMSGVEAVYTGHDIPHSTDLTPPLAPPNGPVYSTPRPLLARDRVRYVG